MVDMDCFSYAHIDDVELSRKLDAALDHRRVDTAHLLALIGEYDSRRLYLPKGFPSTFRYCVDGRGLQGDSAYKYIRAARAARDFPQILGAVAGGRLNLTGVVLLAPYLT